MLIHNFNILEKIKNRIIFVIIRKLITRKLNVPKSCITLSTNLKTDLGMDSLALFELAHDVMNLFHLDFIDEQILAHFKTLDDIVFFVYQENNNFQLINIIKVLWF